MTPNDAYTLVFFTAFSAGIMIGAILTALVFYLFKLWDLK